jgi:His/Glu/Gln/Arg/opine family amino acid ABC transporter permease subunit
MELNWTYFFSLFSMAMFWRAVVTVVELGTLSWLSWLSWLVLGILVASAELSTMLWLRCLAKVYFWFFRSVPLLVLLVFVFNMPQIFHAAGPFLSVPFISGLISMVLTETAYMAEIHRGGLLSVCKGQSEAGRALGLGFWGTGTHRRATGLSDCAAHTDQRVCHRHQAHIAGIGNLVAGITDDRPTPVRAKFSGDGGPAGRCGVLRDDRHRIQLGVPVA